MGVICSFVGCSLRLKLNVHIYLFDPKHSGHVRPVMEPAGTGMDKDC